MPGEAVRFDSQSFDPGSGRLVCFPLESIEGRPLLRIMKLASARR